MHELCDKGNKWAAYAIYEKYRWGDEEHGIFIDKERAKEYYDMAGDIPYKAEWDPIDDAGEEYPSTYRYLLTGDAATLDSIRGPHPQSRPALRHSGERGVRPGTLCAATATD